MSKKASYRKHRESVLERNRTYQADNWDRVYARKRERFAERVADDPSVLVHLREQQAQSRRTHPHRIWVKNYRERAARAGHEPVVEHFTKADVIERYGDSCFYCETGEFEHLDHATPVSKGGPHTLDNVRPSCAFCNYSKHNRDLSEWSVSR